MCVLRYSNFVIYCSLQCAIGSRNGVQCNVELVGIQHLLGVAVEWVWP